ncbi:hypothetical protein H4R19_005523 [Coemansia spiralis]|nr:hypothetical protein H4R19_005523 [Coemansia spiralis]
MLKWIFASTLLALLLTWASRGQRESGWPPPSQVLRRATVADVPNYVRVSPDYVALAPAAPDGATAAAINDMMCLANRHRYDKGMDALALDAELVRYAQARAELLAATNAKIVNNAVAGGGSAPIDFNKTFWANVEENMVRTTADPTFAYWALEKSAPAEANIAGAKFMYFGVGQAGNYYVQTFGVPKNAGADRSLFPWCPSNETFYGWTFPRGTPDKPRAAQPAIAGKPFPYQAAAARAPVFYNTINKEQDSGLTSDGTVPYLKDLSIIDTVAAANSKTPFAAIANAGELGLTKEELNLVVCMVNARRYASCLPPVALHSQLIAAAQAHSYEMNRAHNMSHYGSSGPMGMRIRRRGFSFSAVGENVAYGVHDAYTMFAMFSESQPHLDNMLDPDFTFVGSGRSGQYWTMSFGAYLDKAATPPVASLPLCPGNSTDIAIAFPAGVPATPKLQATACGGTKATPVVPPPYIQTHTGDAPTRSRSSSKRTRTSSTPASDPSTAASDSSTAGDVKSDSSQPGPATPTNDPSPAPTSGTDDAVTTTQTVAQTVFVDGDKLMASWQRMCRATPTGLRVDPPGYSAVPLGSRLA